MTKKKKLVTALTVLAILVVLAASGWLAAYYFYRPDYLESDVFFDVSAVSYGEEITVMSYNVRYLSAIDCGKKSWFYRADLVTQTVARSAPDLIGFQEVTSEHEKYLTEHLQGYSFHIVYRDDSAAKEATAIAYRADRFELESEGHFWLSETPDVQSKNWKSERYRDANYVVLTEKTTGKKFAFYNTHLDAKSALARDKGMAVLLEQTSRTPSLPIILTGDMNDCEDSPMYVRATEAGLCDSAKIAEKTFNADSVTFTGYGKSTSPRIDFCFLSKGIKVSSYAIDNTLINGDYPSDHFPVVVKFVL